MRRLFPLVFALLPSVALAAKGAASDPMSSLSDRPMAMMSIIALLSLLPFAAVMLTSFSKIAVVLSLARSAMGTQQAPPTLVLTGLAMVLSAAIMAPVGEEMWELGSAAYRSAGRGADLVESMTRTVEPLKRFLIKHGSPEQRAEFLGLAKEMRTPERAAQVSEEDAWVVVPSFVLTELKEAFQIGFLIFLPFLVLDMVVANVLLALGMQSLPPSQVSLPFKLLLFVAVDGWALLARGLVQGYR